jgi:hypothetical protein
MSADNQTSTQTNENLPTQAPKTEAQAQNELPSTARPMIAKSISTMSRAFLRASRGGA